MIGLRGWGQVSATGQGIATLVEAKPVITPRAVKTAFGEREILTYTCAEVTLPASVPEPVARRMSRLSKMALAAVDEAIRDAFPSGLEDTSRLGLAVGTAFGAFDLANAFQKRIYVEGAIGASPSLFAASVQNSIASQISAAYKIHGPCTTVMTMEHTALNTLRAAYDWIEAGAVDHAVVVIGDEVSDYMAYTLAHQPASRALNPTRDEFTMIAGEGAVALVLSRANPRVKIAELAIHAEKPPAVERFFTAACGMKNQHGRYTAWLGGHAATSHAALYGGLITGAAFETLLAALAVRDDGQPTAVVQLSAKVSDRDEAQFLVLSPP